MKFSDKIVLNVFAKASPAILLLLSSIVMVRSLPREDYGAFLQAMMIANTAVMLTAIGLPQSIYYFFPQITRPASFVARNVLLLQFISIVTAIIVFYIQPQLSQWLKNPKLIEFFWVVPMLIFFQGSSSFREPILISSGNLVLNSILTVLTSAIYFIPVMVSALFVGSLYGVLATMVASAGVAWLTSLLAILWLVNKLHEEKPSRKYLGSTDKKVNFAMQFRYAFPLGISSYMGIIHQYIDQYLISFLFQPKDFAVYSRGAMNIPILSTFHFTIADIMMPTYVKAYKDGDIKKFLYYYHLSIEKVAKINFPVCFFLFPVVPSLITFLYTMEYVQAAPIFRVYLFLILISVAVYGLIARSTGNTSCVMYISALSIIFNLLLSILLVTKMGTVGAAFATVFTSIFSACCYLSVSCRLLKVSLKEIFPWKYLLRLLVLSIGASLPVYVIEVYFSPQGIMFLLKVFVEGLLYFYCFSFFAVRTSILNQEDFLFLNRWLRFDAEKMLKRMIFYCPSKVS